MAKPMLSPALTGPTGLAVLVIERIGHWTATLAVDVAEPSLPVVTLAVLLTVAQSCLLVVEVMWIVGSLATPRLAKVQLSTWVPTGPVIAQPVTDGLMLQLRSPPAGSGSLTVTPVAVPGPLLLTTMSKPMPVPALTGPAGLAVLVMWMVGHCTPTLATGELAKASLLATTVALLLTVAQSAALVEEVTWMAWLVWAPMSPRLQVRVWAPTEPPIEQPVTDGLMLQSRSSPAGRVSLTVTACAVPGPALLTVMSKPMLSPALTGPTGLAVLVIDRFGHWTATLAVDVAEPSLLAAPVAVLLTVAQSAWVVVEVMWTVGSLATPRVPAKLQPSTWVPTGPVIEQPVTAGLMLQFRSVPAGSGSFTATFAAVPGPLLVTTMSKPLLSPELTGPAGLAVLAMAMFAHWTATLAVAVSWPSLLAAPVAVLLTVAQSSLVVA